MRSYLANDIRVGSTIYRVGKLVDDAVIPASVLVAAGANLIPESPEVAAAAADVVARRALCGLSDQEASDLFLSTVLATGTGARLRAYGDAGVSVSGVEGVGAWSPFVAASGSPLYVTDSVTGYQAVRLRLGDTLSTVAGAASFLAGGEYTVHVLVRYMANGTNSRPVLYDTTALGSRAGAQAQFGDFVGDINFGRSVLVLQYDGSTWFDSSNVNVGPGAFFPMKWSLVTIRATSTQLDVSVDGQFVWADGIAINKPYVQNTNGTLTLRGPFDFMAFEAYAKRLTDDQKAANEARIKARFPKAVGLLKIMAGDPTMHTIGSAFPYVTKLPDGRLYCTIYNGFDGPRPGIDSSDSYTSSDDGDSFQFLQHETQNTPTLLYSDLKTSEPLSDGSIIQVTFTYDAGIVTGSFPIWRRSTDNAATWTAWANADTGVTPNQAFVSMGPMEDPTQLGHLHMIVQTFETAGDAPPNPPRGKVWDYKTTLPPTTWTRGIVLDGVVDAKDYVEPAALTTPTGEFQVLVRDATVNDGSLPMLQTSSAAGNHGVAWSGAQATNLHAFSPGQQARILASGRKVWIGREEGSSTKAALHWRAAGASADALWQSSHFEITPVWGGMYYAALYEVKPGKLLLIAAQHSFRSAFNINVAYRTIDEWLLDFAMPGSATPNSGTVTAGHVTTILLLGAGGFSVVLGSMGSGGSVVVSGSYATYTAGTGNGVDSFHFVDTMGITCASCSFTVTGGTTAPTISSVVPNVGTAAGGTAVTIHGTGFLGATGATVGGVALTSFVVVDSATITGTTAAGTAAAGVDVVVTNGSPGTLVGGWNYLPPNYVLHHRGDFVAKAGSVVSQANDASGHGNDAAFVGNAAATATLDGQPAIQYVNSSDFFSYASFTGGLTAMHFFAVCQNDDDGATAVAAFAYTGDTTQSSFTPLSNRTLYDNTGVTVRDDAIFTPAAGVWSSPWLYEVTSTTGSGKKAFFNRVQVLNAPTDTFGYTAMQRLGGGRGVGYAGRIAEVLMWPAELSGPDKAVVVAYLRARYPSLP